MEPPTALHAAIAYFADYNNCNSFLTDLRWPDGKVTCPQCGSDRVVYLERARVWKCYEKHPKAKFSLKTGTIFEDSPLGLDKWLVALWQIVNCKNAISSCEIARDLGITQKSAWFMVHRLRLALQYGSFGKSSGEVEVDEPSSVAERETCTSRSASAAFPALAARTKLRFLASLNAMARSKRLLSRTVRNVHLSRW